MAQGLFCRLISLEGNYDYGLKFGLNNSGWIGRSWPNGCQIHGKGTLKTDNLRNLC